MLAEFPAKRCTTRLSITCARGGHSTTRGDYSFCFNSTNSFGPSVERQKSEVLNREICEICERLMGNDTTKEEGFLNHGLHGLHGWGKSKCQALVQGTTNPEELSRRRGPREGQEPLEAPKVLAEFWASKCRKRSVNA